MVARRKSRSTTTADSTIVGLVRHHPGFRSRHSRHRRDIWVYLPPGYQQSRQRYPVLYCQDGQNMMDRRTAFLGIEWELDEALEAGIPSGEIAPLIAVCVANTPARRDEYTPTPDPFEGGGKARRYLRFMREELMPFIDRRYRTRRGARNTGVLGSSLGGLLSLHIALHHAHTFGRVAALSPSLWWDHGEILARLAHNGPPPKARLWLDMGTREGPVSKRGGSAAIHATRLARDLLIARGMKLDHTLKYIEAPCGTHNEAAWAARLPWILRFLYPGPIPCWLPPSSRAAPRPIPWQDPI
jgi:predicted alpha/beta superfamily hydrolase